MLGIGVRSDTLAINESACEPIVNEHDSFDSGRVRIPRLLADRSNIDDVANVLQRRLHRDYSFTLSECRGGQCEEEHNTNAQTAL